MWRPDWLASRSKPSFLLRIGAKTVQLWKDAAAGWELASESSVADMAHHPAHRLAPALTALLSEAAPSGKLTVLVDSKWMPVVLLQTGRRPLNTQQVQQLALHRFAELFGEQARQWAVHSSYVAGDVCALAFAYPSLVKAALEECMKSAQRDAKAIELRQLCPTFSWAWDAAQRAGIAARQGWFVAAEQDRLIVSRANGGSLLSLHPGLPPLQSSDALRNALDIEAAKLGLQSGDGKGCGIYLGTSIPTDGSAHEGFRWHALSLGKAAA